MTDFDFPLYAAVWYHQSGWEIPEVHFKIFEYLEDEENWGKNKTKIVLLWRGIGKSTITDLWVAYKLTKNPALRFLIMSADGETAKKSTQDILQVLRRHPFSQHLIKAGRDLEVRKDSFFVAGHVDNRNSSVKAKGILSNVTGGRADYIIFDDIEVPKNSGTAHKREELRRRVSEANNLLVPEVGRRLFIGTYHDPESIYDEVAQNGASKLRVPLITNIKGDYPYMEGDSQWPERFSNQWILEKQLSCHSKSEWLSQYLLIPASTSDSVLDVARIKMYDKEVDFVSANNSYHVTIGEHVIRSVSCFWDPAISSARGDDSVVAVVFSDDDNNYFIHRTIAVVGDTDDQCKAVKRIALEFNIPIVNIEMNGIGAMLPPMLIKHLEGTGIGVNSASIEKRRTTGSSKRLKRRCTPEGYTLTRRLLTHLSFIKSATLTHQLLKQGTTLSTRPRRPSYGSQFGLQLQYWQWAP
ncbi:phage terminase large subunit [Methylomonas koyamae]|uniref:phage terminase large subunit n=1 Tax=Methylomonas koyamae TaxID=702114 RepID=UPI0006D0C125|nr:phage terminase large subunit [Methylomonas koyamae]